MSIKADSIEVMAWEVMVLPVLTVYPEQGLADAIRMFLSNKCSAIPVIDKNKKLQGVISYIDIIDRLIKKQSMNVKISSVMQTEDLPVMKEDEPVVLEDIRDIVCICDNGVLNGVIYLDYLAEVYFSKIQRYAEFEKLSKQYEIILNNCYDSIFVTDGQGEVIWVNASSERVTGSSAGTLGKNVSELEAKLFFPSATNLVLKEKKTKTVLQEVASGEKVVVTSSPVFDNNGKILMVVTVARNVEQLIKDVENHIKMNELKEIHARLNEAKKLSEKYYLELQELRKEKIARNQVIANSYKMKRILALTKNVASVDSTVLILGESGVGKDVVSKLIHELSDRKECPYMKINCGAIPDTLLESELFGYEAGAFTGAQKTKKLGLIEIADGGTLFLDEVAELPLNLQVKLLQVIEEKTVKRLGGTNTHKVDIRIIAATNKDIKSMVNNGKFREDLFYRLNVIQITIPPLRERKEDIIPLTMHFIDKYNKKYNRNKQISSGALEYLMKYNWPGNIRELQNQIERLVVMGEQNIILPEDLPDEISKLKIYYPDNINFEDLMPLRDALEALEKKLIKTAFEKCKSTTKAAKLLGVNQSTIVRKIHKYDI
ncbi:MAG: sigma 54-interacting transcriptional regulator [Clostridiaceae bacterium]|jgi:PAS domain S-box-containing protein|nr:sigma 54-interacting transcriptional regulator [Clostridiaceae bacterium]